MVRGYFYLVASLMLSVYALIELQYILTPMVFSVILFVVLRPLHKRWLRLVKIPLLAVLLTLLSMLIPLAAFVLFFSFQIIDVVQNFPSITNKVQAGIDQAFSWIGDLKIIRNFDWSSSLEENVSSGVAQAFDLVRVGIAESTQIFANVFLTFLYLLFLLLYHDGLRKWSSMIIGSAHSKWHDIISEIKSMIEHYLIGVFTVVVILSILNSLGLVAIGMQYAIFWGVLAGFLALIPYIGTAIGGAFPLLYAIATGSSWFQPVMVVILFGSIQFIEGNFITPKIVGNQVSLNPLTAIVSLVLGAAIWGLSGVVLAIPIAGVVRIVCSHFELLQPMSFVMGTAVSEYKESK
ncbi:MAG: AI-2E family transporter [Saprospiraceae bacterium]|nr:AI-2E family transporter [Saprospiraceae bacterium]